MRSSRRDFLKGKSAIDAVGDLGRALDASAAAGSNSERAEGVRQPVDDVPRKRSYVIEVSRRAMACQFEVFLNASESAAATERAIEALDVVEHLEDQLSIYRNHSELCELNSVANRRAMRTEIRLFKLLQESRRIHEATDGAFDITAGPLIQLWAQCRREGSWPDAKILADVLARVNSKHIELDEIAQTVRFSQPGTTINLGGIGKGYALDRCAELLTDGAVADFMMHGGSSSVIARGTRNADNDRAGWIVGVRHPLREDRRLLDLELVDAAVGTSGAGTKQFYHQGKRYGHVLDPRSGLPAEGVLSATVVAPSAALADALSTAFYVLGPDRTADYCRSHPEVSVLMTTTSRRTGCVEVHPINCDQVKYRMIKSALIERPPDRQ